MKHSFNFLSVVVLTIAPVIQALADDEVVPLYQVGKNGNYCISITRDETGCISGSDNNGNPVNIVDVIKSNKVVFYNLTDVVHDMRFTGANKGDLPPQRPNAAVAEKKMNVVDLSKEKINCTFHGDQLAIGYRVPAKSGMAVPEQDPGTGNFVGKGGGTPPAKPIVKTGLSDVSEFIMKRGSKDDIRQLATARADVALRLPVIRPDVAMDVLKGAAAMAPQIRLPGMPLNPKLMFTKDAVVTSLGKNTNLSGTDIKKLAKLDGSALKGDLVSATGDSSVAAKERKFGASDGDINFEPDFDEFEIGPDGERRARSGVALSAVRGLQGKFGRPMAKLAAMGDFPEREKLDAIGKKRFGFLGVRAAFNWLVLLMAILAYVAITRSKKKKFPILFFAKRNQEKKENPMNTKIKISLLVTLVLFSFQNISRAEHQRGMVGGSSDTDSGGEAGSASSGGASTGTKSSGMKRAIRLGSQYQSSFSGSSGRGVASLSSPSSSDEGRGAAGSPTTNGGNNNQPRKQGIRSEQRIQYGKTGDASPGHRFQITDATGRPVTLAQVDAERKNLADAPVYQLRDNGRVVATGIAVDAESTQKALDQAKHSSKDVTYDETHTKADREKTIGFEWRTANGQSVTGRDMRMDESDPTWYWRVGAVNEQAGRENVNLANTQLQQVFMHANSDGTFSPQTGGGGMGAENKNGKGGGGN